MAQNKVALVTGSGKRRIGAGIADALAEYGYSLVIHYHLSKDEALAAVAGYESRGVHALAIGADLTDEQAARSLVKETLRQFGRIDVLVNAAATYGPKRLEDVTANDVRRHFQANLLATFICSQEAGLAMVKQPEGGCIVTFGDWATERPYRNYAAYFASKAAMPGLTRALAVELGTRNPKVRVNCIMPGPVLFPPDMPEAEKQEAIAATLVKREGKPESIAQAVLFLIQNEFVTGICLPVDGGRTIYAPESG